MSLFLHHHLSLSPLSHLLVRSLYSGFETYIQDAQKANKAELVEIWQTIKSDRKKHMRMLKETLEKVIHG